MLADFSGKSKFKGSEFLLAGSLTSAKSESMAPKTKKLVAVKVPNLMELKTLESLEHELEVMGQVRYETN